MNENFKLKIFLFQFFHTNLSMANWPPLYVQQYHFCSAFSSSRSLCSTSKIFLMNFLRFKDQKTTLMMTILSWKYFYSIFYTNLSMANWPRPFVQQHHVCSAFSTWRSLCRHSKIFLIDFLSFKDQKYPLMMTILSCKYFDSIFFTNLSLANWPPPWVQQNHLCSAF